MGKTLIKVQKLTKSYDGKAIFKNLHFTIKQGEVLAVIGYSGCGKSTLLRILGGFEKPDTGEVLLDSVRVVRPSKDKIMIFQDFAQLLPWRTVLDNVVWPMLVTGAVATRTEAMEITKKCLADMELSESNFQKFPSQLSGGMKQRVAVARALALKPKVLLMDEPFGALDILTRKKMQIITREVCEKHHVATVLVTHSVAESVIMSDKILVFCPNGKTKIIKNDAQADPIIEELLNVK